jgi:D-alanine-D-alanine ligase
MSTFADRFHERFSSLVLVAEDIDRAATNDFQSDRTLMMAEREYVETIIGTINSLGLKLEKYTNLDNFAKYIGIHKKDLVLPLWAGDDGRNSLHFVSALCEINSIKYLGPDIHGRILERDKWLSKQIAVQCGFQAPASRVLHLNQIKNIDQLPAITSKVVAKPRYEGSSIGIAATNLCSTDQEVWDSIEHIGSMAIEDVILEEFVKGKEVHIPVIGNSNGARFLGAYETFVRGKPDYFSRNLLEVQLKTRTPYAWEVRPINLGKHTRQYEDASSNLFAELGYPSLIRIDGKLHDERFYFLEVNSIPDFGPKSVAAFSYISNNSSYENLVQDLISTSFISN